MSLLDAVSRMVQPLQQRVLLSIGRALIKGTDDSGRLHSLQLAALKGELMAEVPQMVAYGLGSRVLPADEDGGPEAVIVCVGGNRDHPVAIATEDRRHRPTDGLEPGEVCLYDDQGTTIKLKRGNILQIDVAGGTEGQLIVNAGIVDINCETATITAEDTATIDAREAVVDCLNAQVNAIGIIDLTAVLTRVTGLLSVTGDLLVTGNISDQSGTSPKSMAAMRSVYNTHLHGHSPHTAPTTQM